MARRMNIGQGFISNDPDREKKKPKTVAGRKLSKVKTNKNLFTKWANKQKKKRYLKMIYVKFHKDKKFDLTKTQKKIPVKIWIPWV